jgi:guanine deaminase
LDKVDLMRRAIELCRQELAAGSGSWCASLVVRDGEIVGEGCNTVTETPDPTAHCEVNAMRAAAKRLGSWDLSGCDLFTTWEPCPMCVAAIWWARIDRVYYANLLADTRRFGMDIDPLAAEVRRPPEARSRPYERLLADEALRVVENWWKRARPEPIA